MSALGQRFLKLNFCDICAMVFLQPYAIMPGGRLREAVAMTGSAVLGFQRRNSSFFCSIKGLFKSNCTVRVGVILNNQTDLALTIHFHLSNTE